MLRLQMPSALCGHCTVGSEMLNPIRLLNAMIQSDEVALVPLVFGYMTYSEPERNRNRIAFSNCPGRQASGVLGGTGRAFSRRATPSRELHDHVASLMSAELQTGLVPDFSGQPSARLAWIDDRVNRLAGDFYRNTLDSAERAFLRPRFDRYVAFQTAASARLRRALAASEDIFNPLADIRRLWQTARSDARGPLDDDRGSFP